MNCPLSSLKHMSIPTLFWEIDKEASTLHFVTSSRKPLRSCGSLRYWAEDQPCNNLLARTITMLFVSTKLPRTLLFRCCEKSCTFFVWRWVQHYIDYIFHVSLMLPWYWITCHCSKLFVPQFHTKRDGNFPLSHFHTTHNCPDI